MSRQAMIEVVLDRWVTSSDLRYIKENYGSFYHDPFGNRDLAYDICEELGDNSIYAY